MRQIKYIIFSIFFICQNISLLAQFDNVKFERVSAQFGLPNGYIRDIVEDRFGYIWFGTREGVFRYDGYEFKAFRHNVLDSMSLAHPNVNEILEDRDGKIWVATSFGLSLLDRRTGNFHRFRRTPKEDIRLKKYNGLNKLVEDKLGNLILGFNGEISYFNKTSKQFSDLKEKDKPDRSNFVRTFLKDKNDVVWAGTSRGLIKIKPGDLSIQVITGDTILAKPDYKSIRKICENKTGEFWLATDGGLLKWNPKTNTSQKDFLPVDLRNIPINNLTLDSKGNLWIALRSNGLGVYNSETKQFHHFKHQANLSNSLNHNQVSHILEDRFQNIWIGTENGISKIRLDDSGFELLQNEATDGNLSNNITRFIKDSRGTIYSKTPQGIYQIPKGETQGQKLKEFSDKVTGISWDWFLEDSEGGLWFTVSRDGVYRKDKSSQQFEKINVGDSLTNTRIFKMFNDKIDKDIIWFGTVLGLCRFNWKTLESRWYFPRKSFKEVYSNRMVIFEQDNAGKIWMYYTYSSCLGSFDPTTEKFELILPPPGNKITLDGDMKDIAVGSDGNIWIANLYGLVNFNTHTKEFKMFGKEQGLLENELLSVLIDKNDQVWVCGYRFFARLDQSNNTFYNYQNAKKIQSFLSKSRHLAKDGSISFGSINGVYTFHPDRINKNEIPPDVILTDFKVKNESYLLEQAFESSEKINLSYDENDIAFEFSGLHYINPAANEYRCKLVGYDESWRELGREHKVTYTNLNHGQYTFRATASNGDGVWNEEGLIIQLTIAPAYWQTLWFKALLCLVFISIAYALFKNRQHRLMLQRQKVIAEQSAEYKTQFLANVSHEIRTPMNAIVGLSKLSLDTNLDNKQTEYIGAIQESSQNLLTIINDLLDHTKLEAGKFSFIKKPFKLKNLTDQLNNTFKHSAKEKQLAFDISVDENVDLRIIGDQLRLNQILINLIGNGIKFTDEGKVWLKVKNLKDSTQDIHIRFEVGDTGIGIPKDKIDYIFESFNQSEEGVMKGMEGTGLGLSIAKQLVEKQGGELFIESKIGEGTRLWFDLVFEKTDIKKELQAQNKTATQIDQLKILVVEDTYFNQLLVVEILKKHIKFPEIVVAENGKIALDLLNNQSFDIILMDVKMPVMNGFEATRIIRESVNDKIRNTPILAVTANAVPEQLKKCTDAGMDDYVTKPIDDKDLLKKIIQLTQNKNHD